MNAPPPAPPRPSDDLVTRFDALALAQGPEQWVGGFAPAHTDRSPTRAPAEKAGGSARRWLSPFRRRSHDATPAPSSPPPPSPPLPPKPQRAALQQPAALPRPPPLPPLPSVRMPVPQLGVPERPSLTMQHALSAPADVARPTSAPASAPAPGSSTPQPARLHPQAALQLAPPAARPRAASSPPSPTASSKSEKAGLIRCSGFTAEGKRCGRQLRARPPLRYVNPNAEAQVFCFQHTKQVMENSGIRMKNGVWVEFDELIPGYLHDTTKAALRSLMADAPKTSDEPGYIYVFEIRDPKTPGIVHLKVGRSVNLVTRLSQWARQCGSKEQVLRGWWPAERDGASLLKGRVQAGAPGPYCHRVERLVHIELADLVLYRQYLHPDFPNVPPPSGGSAATSPTASAPSTPARPTRGRKSRTPSPAAKAPGKSCPDCGTVHKEIFSFARVETGEFTEREYELVVKPVIEKWGKFVSNYDK